MELDTTPENTQQPTTVRTSTRAGLRDSILGTRNLMTVAALAVVGSLITIPLSYITPLVATTPHGVLIMCALMGIWFIPYMLPGVIINKPGVFLVSGLILGVISTFTTSFGVGAIVGNLIGSSFVGLPILLLLYRVWKWWAYTLSAVVFGGMNGYMYWGGYSITGSTTEIILSVAISIASCILGVFICIALKNALNRAGVGINN